MSIGLLVGYAIMIIRKIIMNYDEPAKTSVGEVARYRSCKMGLKCDKKAAQVSKSVLFG